MSKVAASLGYYGRAAGRRFGELRRIHGIPVEIFYSDPKDRVSTPAPIHTRYGDLHFQRPIPVAMASKALRRATVPSMRRKSKDD
jgi:hypothetical protein